MVHADLQWGAVSPPHMLMFILFRAIEGELGSQGFPEQFDQLCCTQSSRGFHSCAVSARARLDCWALL